MVTKAELDEESKNTFSKKWSKKLPPDIEETKSRIDALTDDELKVKISQWMGAICEVERDLENDSKINAMKESLKELIEPYKFTAMECMAQVRYASFVLSSRGK